MATCDGVSDSGLQDITASTGIAAVNVGGITIHSWAGIGLGDASRGNSESPAIACVGENAEKLAECVIKVHDDRTTWQKLQGEAFEFVKTTHDRERYKSRIEAAIGMPRHK